MDMMDICKENGAYDAKHFLCYYYYGGMIYTGLKNFERALYFYEQVLLRSLTVYTVLYIVSHHKIQTLFLTYSFICFVGTTVFKMNYSGD